MEDIAAVNRLMPEYIGFVFAPSKRRIDIKTAVRLKESLDSVIEAVGVFVNESIEEISEIYGNGIIDIVQLHGDEDDSYVSRLKDKCGCRVIKSVPVGISLPPSQKLPASSDYLLFDTLSIQRGGVGKPFDWNVLKEYCGKPYFLAGGLSAQNVSHAMRLLNPYCVDVSSGVETDGVKDPLKIEKFVNTVRGK